MATGSRPRTTSPRARLAVHLLEDRVVPAGEPAFRGGLTVAAADVNQDGRADLIGAPGPGTAPRVVVYDGATGEPVTKLDAFEPGFLGGVYVAVGDVTGDFLPEVVCGAGEGGGPRVAVFDPRTGDRLADFFAYAADFRGGVRVAAGDLDGNLRDEIVTAPGPGGEPHVRAFDGAGAPAGRPGFLAYAADFRGGVAVAAGDFDGDGRDDLVTAPGAGGAAHVKVFKGTTGELLNNFYAFDPAGRGGAWVAAGDVDGNGLADVVAGAGEGADPVVRVFADGTQFAEWAAYEATFRGGVRVAAGDVNGDAFADVLTAAEGGGGPHVAVWDGYTFARTASFFVVTDDRAVPFASPGTPAPPPLFVDRQLAVPAGGAGTADLTADLLRRLNGTRGEVGLYPVDDFAGSVGGVSPGDPGYPAAALADGRRLPLLAADSGPGTNATVRLPSFARYGVYLIPNGSSADWLAANPANDPAGGPVALFPFPPANPGGRDLFRTGPRNRAAYEDGTGGDFDRNDLVVGFRTPPPPDLPNTPPSTSDIPTQRALIGTPTGPIPFTVSDAETAAADLVVTATADPSVALTVGGSGANRTVDVAPIGAFVGTVPVTLRVRDLGGFTTNSTFDVVFEAPPLLFDIPADQVVPAGGTTGPLPFTVDDPETPADELVVTAASSDPALLPPGSIVLGGSGRNRTVTVNPPAGQAGTATVTLTVTDGSGRMATGTFAVDVARSGGPRGG